MTTKGYWKKSKFYWDVDINEALEQAKILQGKELEEWKTDAVKKIERRHAVRTTFQIKEKGRFEMILDGRYLRRVVETHGRNVFQRCQYEQREAIERVRFRVLPLPVL